MDIVTQGLAGAILAQSFAKDKEVRVAMVVGFLAGLLADVDAVLTFFASDPLLQLDFHRHFSHSIFFIPIGGLCATLLMWPVLKKHLSFKRLLLFCTVAYATSGLIDTCTSYGTSLLWPFSDARIAWSIVSILDPLFSLALIIAIVLTLLKKNPRYAFAGIAFACSYLLLGFVQHERVRTMTMDLAQSRGHEVERIEVKPTMGNLLLWRAIYESKGSFYIDAYRASMLGDDKVYEGEKVKRFMASDLATLQVNSTMAKDIQRFDFFSSGFVALFTGKETMVGDIRYSMLANSSQPIWGIVLDMNQQDQHTPFVQYHDASKQTRQQFMSMLLGE
ncbi:MAG: metal-dependent hydrolase [Mariprofundaceae bacterium]|nr:metal-dependent hydrolase [Mariprofundaceae bacterium]